MKPHSVRSTLLAAALALAPACSQRETVPQLQLVTRTCDGLEPLREVTHLLLRVTGEGLEAPIERLATTQLLDTDLPPVPAGRARVLEVRGYAGYPGTGRLVSLGRTAPFDVPEAQAEAPLALRVFLRRVGSFVPPNSATGQEACQALSGGGRAGHTATLLKDGRVLFAGGFRTERDGAATTLATAEYFDPASGTFELAPEVGARAFHTATALPDGQVLLAGGETVSADNPVRLRGATLLDPATGALRAVELQEARSRHAAAADEGGRVLLVGGVGASGAVLSRAEGLDAQGVGFPVSTALPRVGASVVALQGGRLLAVVGGSDGRVLQEGVETFAFSGGTFVPGGVRAILKEPRRNAAVTAFESAERLVVTGGYLGAEEPGVEARPLASGEVLTAAPTSLQVTAGPAIVARGDVCAVTLPDGRVVTVGGRRLGGTGILRSTGEVEVLTPTASATAGVLGMTALAQPRYLHTCTALPDGTVLIAGGVDDSGGEPRALDDVLIFTPPPRD